MRLLQLTSTHLLVLVLAVAPPAVTSSAAPAPAEPGGCTPPHSNTHRPYCVVPDTVSWQAQRLLKTKHVVTDFPVGVSAAAVLCLSALWLAISAIILHALLCCARCEEGGQHHN